MLFRTIFLSLFCVLSLSCAIEQSPLSCVVAERQVDMQFSYTHNPQDQEQLAELVGNIRVYAFDQSSGLLTRILLISRDDIARGSIQADIPEGTYTFVCWASDGEDLSRGGYFDARMTDPAHHVYTPEAQVGITTFDEFRLMLACDPLPEGSVGELVPKIDNFDDLFYSIMRDVQVGSAGGSTVGFDFIRNTSILKIKVSGTENLPVASRAEGAVTVFVTAPHERYSYDNTLAPYSRQVRFEVPATLLPDGTIEADIKVHRLETQTHISRPVLLHIQDTATGADIVQPVNVVDAILMAQDSSGNPLWQTQDDIDREYEFDIEVALRPTDGTDLQLGIIVEGFEVIILEVFVN